MSRLMRTALTVALVLLSLLAVAGAAAVVTGRAGLVATHGVSMHPVYDQGDLVVIARTDTYRSGQLVAYRRPGHSDLVLHRIVGGDARGFVFKGDNNPAVDPTRPTQDQLAGRAVLHLPHVGLWLHHLSSPPGLALLTLTVLAGGGRAAALGTRNRRQRRRTRMSTHASHARMVQSVRGLPPAVRIAATGLASVAVLGAAVAAFTWTAPAAATLSERQGSASKVTFAYTAAVGRTAAYDTTVASSPDPVFRKLADTVAVSYTYTGRPGSVSVAAQLSTESGWHSTLPLARSTAITSSPFRGSVMLDLTAVEARARAAAAAAGLPESLVSVAVTPRFQAVDGSVFAPALRLTMTPQQLALARGAETLTVTDAGRRSASVTHAPRSLDVFGVNVPVAPVRAAGFVLLLTALTALALVCLVPRRITSPDEGADIRRRYAPLLVKVHPMTAPSQRPVIDVTTFATLVRLAERYGLLVLHWSRSEVDTFLVQDEAATYRYRTGALADATDTAESDAADLVDA